MLTQRRPVAIFGVSLWVVALTQARSEELTEAVTSTPADESCLLQVYQSSQANPSINAARPTIQPIQPAPSFHHVQRKSTVMLQTGQARKQKLAFPWGPLQKDGQTYDSMVAHGTDSILLFIIAPMCLTCSILAVCYYLVFGTHGALEDRFGFDQKLAQAGFKMKQTYSRDKARARQAKEWEKKDREREQRAREEAVRVAAAAAAASRYEQQVVATTAAAPRLERSFLSIVKEDTMFPSNSQGALPSSEPMIAPSLLATSSIETNSRSERLMPLSCGQNDPVATINPYANGQALSKKTNVSTDPFDERVDVFTGGNDPRKAGIHN
jgi:hypothetical protein